VPAGEAGIAGIVYCVPSRTGKDWRPRGCAVSGGPELGHDADRLVPDHQTGPHRILAAQDVKVRPADGRQRDPDHGLADAGPRTRDLVDPDVTDAVNTAARIVSMAISARRTTASSRTS
jgi:hypothetical protein